MADRSRRRLFFGSLLLLVLAGAAGWTVFALSTPRHLPQAPVPCAALGINLAGPCDWNTELPFIDLMRFSRAWSPQQKGVPFGKGPAFEVDRNGYPLSLAEGTWAESPLLSFFGHKWPSGVYHVFYQGRGRLSFGASAKSVVSDEPGHLVVDLDSAKGDLHLSILATEIGNHVRDIHVIMPGFENSWRKNPWSPSFLDRWRGVKCVRFMDFMATNNSTIRTWSERPVIEDSTFAARGVPVELLADLSNRLMADPWVCIPHMADDDYVRQFAKCLRDRVDPALRVHIEYSNEVWNSGFQQNKYAAAQGMALGLAKEPWVAAWLYTSRRSVEIFRIFEEVFGGTRRLVRILPAQSGNLFMAKQILEFEGAARRADAIAIAPYMGLVVGTEPTRYVPLTAGEVGGWGMDKLFEHLGAVVFPEARKSMKEYRGLAVDSGLQLVAYEGGQHLVGVLGAENDATLTSLFLAANADPRMGALYSTYLDAWQEEGGMLFCHFSSVAKWTKWGSWGLMEFYDDNPADSPKFRAVRAWAEGLKSSKPAQKPAPAP